MRKERLGGLETRIAGGSDGDGGGDGAVVVLLHGYGAPGDDLVPLMGEIEAPRGTRFVFPEAPLAMGPSIGRAWWHIDMARIERMLVTGGKDTRDPKEIPEGLDDARAKVIAMLDELERALSPSRIVLGGFSQGAMLACDTVLRTERAFAGLVMLSGTIVCEDEWTKQLPKRRGLPVFQSHGSHDPILPMAIAERLKGTHIEAGLDVQWVPFRGGHEIPMPVLDALSAFVKKTLGAT